MNAVILEVGKNYNKELGLNADAALDPAFFEWLFRFFIDEVIPALQNCNNNPDDGLTTVRSPGPWAKFHLKRSLVRDMGRKEFRVRGQQLFQALLATGGSVKREDFMELWNAA